ncbi:hypothetical protein VT84_25375 [Gemmata sp. SH-PL17]|uniref:hypothetical protein n=1 Tax=Gemmata sp. SH-PL17 TaxID=1630693 RepID=UPI00078CBE32|nr:hypothetical protein [Gemmata sp. SH-PL17]AMV27758.1 hypothetical protein VT84_25375 [Gemmata sp. SH-PL17]
MLRAVHHWITAAAVVVLLAAASPAQAGFITYSFTTDSSVNGGSVTGSFQVDQADLADGLLSTADIKNYKFTFKDSSGVMTIYALEGVFPDIAVDTLTGIPTGTSGSVLGTQGDAGLVQAFLTSDALTPGASGWAAVSQSSDGATADGGTGHWDIGPSTVTPTPAPAGVVLAVSGIGCLALVRRFRPRLVV